MMCTTVDHERRDFIEKTAAAAESMTPADQARKVKEWFAGSKLDAGITGETVGVAHDSVTPEVLLGTTAKLLKISRKESDGDNRDNLKYSVVFGLEDLLKERIERDAGQYQRKARMKMEQKKDLSWLHAGFFTPQIKSVLTGTNHTQQVDIGSPIELLSNAHKVSRLGPGAISSPQTAPDSARQVHPSYFGFFDVAKSSESIGIGLDNHVTDGVYKGKDNKFYREVIDSKGEKVLVDHFTLLNSKVALPEIK